MADAPKKVPVQPAKLKNDLSQPCALTLKDLPSPCLRCGATDDGANGYCPLEDE